jgi:lipopolysaccharide heptosyltransferase II
MSGGHSWAAVKRLLCVRLDSMGDVLMTTPALRAFKRSAPGRSVTLLTSRSGAAVAPFVREVDDSIEFIASWMKASATEDTHDAALIDELKARRFDAAAIFTVYSQSPLPAAYLCYLAGIPLRLAHCRENPYRLLTDWVPDPEPQHMIRHEVRRHLDLAAEVGCRTTDERLSFTVPKRARAAAAIALRAAGVGAEEPLIVVHPGASAPSRCYPGRSFARAMDLVLQRSYGAVIFTGSAEEVALVEAIRAQMAGKSYSLAGRLTLGELGAVLERAALLIANNTGPVHIAAALGTPVVDLYALTNPQHTPWGVRNVVLFEDVPCRFCYKSVCPMGHHQCLSLVAPEAVAAAAEQLLRSDAAPAGHHAMNARSAAINRIDARPVTVP